MQAEHARIADSVGHERARKPVTTTDLLARNVQVTYIHIPKHKNACAWTTIGARYESEREHQE